MFSLCNDKMATTYRVYFSSDYAKQYFQIKLVTTEAFYE